MLFLYLSQMFFERLYIMLRKVYSSHLSSFCIPDGYLQLGKIQIMDSEPKRFQQSQATAVALFFGLATSMLAPYFIGFAFAYRALARRFSTSLPPEVQLEVLHGTDSLVVTRLPELPLDQDYELVIRRGVREASVRSSAATWGFVLPSQQR